MTHTGLTPGHFPQTLLRPTVDYILAQQQADGAIPWYQGHKADPWDMIEAAMGLSIGGEQAAAERAYAWLARHQLPDGSWWANYLDDTPVDEDHRETNFVAYIATGVWHHYLITGDQPFLEALFPCVQQALTFVLRYQAPSGEIYWAVDAQGQPKRDALVTACASIYKSLACAILCADALGHDSQGWRLARQRLGHTLRHHPECFDRTWESKARYSMDWFYPILTGVLDATSARERLASRWDIFMEPSLGCRCVSDQPWVTVAESCELTLALLAAGEPEKANVVFNDLQRLRDTDGGYWTGYNFRDQVIWPQEKTTWTAGAILLAADALSGHTPASRLFVEHEALAPESPVLELPVLEKPAPENLGSENPASQTAGTLV